MQHLLAALKEIKSKATPEFILDEFPQLIFIIDEKGTFLNFFAANDNMLAIPAEAIIGKTLTQLFPPSLVERAMVNLTSTLKTGQETSFDYELPLNNSTSYFQARLMKENKNSVIAFIKDITQWHELQERDAKNALMIKENEQRFKLLAEHLPGAVYLCDNDADSSMLYLNSKVIDVTGYTPDEFISKKINFPDIYHPDDAASIYQQVEECLAQKKSFQLEYRIFHKSGEVRWVEEFGTGVYKDDQLIYLEGYLQDITQRKNAEAKIIEQNEALTKANEELDRFVYSASHDLRSPLSSLIGLINLGSLSESAEETKMLLTRMKERVHDMEHFIKEITYYSQNSRLEVEATEFSLTELIRESIEILSHRDEAKGIVLSISPKEDFRLLADAIRLKIVLNNIIDNAIKYSDPKKKERWVKISCEISGNDYSISIEDNGLGIQPEHHNKIFNMFYRASERSTGSGLGLYIVKETLEKMKGRIEFKSIPGEGSVFQIFIPVKT